MKIIFLDLDGVLNHENFYVERTTRSLREEWHHRYFSPESVGLLNSITDKTGAKIVFSSTHRFHFKTFEELQEGFKLAGVSGELIGITPKLFFSDINDSVPRGSEIDTWINYNIDLYEDRGKLRYAILDDDSDMLFKQRYSFFQTEYKDGLTKEIANKVIKHLNK